MQVIRLCRQHRLTSALAYLFPRALLDYVAPVAELAVAIVNARADEQNSQEPDNPPPGWKLSKVLGFKLLTYLRTHFAGLTFPPGKYIVVFSASAPFKQRFCEQSLRLASYLS